MYTSRADREFSDSVKEKNPKGSTIWPSHNETENDKFRNN